MKNNIRWIYFISRRFSSIDRKGKSRITSILATTGIALGVMALIVVMSVMNGFQKKSIDAVMAVDSYHIRVSGIEDSPAFFDWLKDRREISSFTPFIEGQTLLVSSRGRQSPCLIRGVAENIWTSDRDFASEIEMWRGNFDLKDSSSIVVGNMLARRLGLGVGSKVNLLAVSGESKTPLISADRIWTVTGVFHTGYDDIDSGLAFISLDDASSVMGISSSSKNLVWGLKLEDAEKVYKTAGEIKKSFENSSVITWKSYNRTFFGALKIEKSIMMLLVLLIFLVVAVNIFNAMRRIVYERSEEIAVLSALGARSKDVQKIFILKGLSIGLTGALIGLVFGIAVCLNMDHVFFALSKISYFFKWIFLRIFSPSSLEFLSENRMFSIFAAIPAQMRGGEVAAISIFGILSALLSSLFASRTVLKLSVSEVLRNE